MKTTITRDEYLQLLGLFTLARQYSADLARVDKAAHRLLDMPGQGATEISYLADEIYGDCNIDVALNAMGITVIEEAANDV